MNEGIETMPETFDFLLIEKPQLLFESCSNRDWQDKQDEKKKPKSEKRLGLSSLRIKVLWSLCRMSRGKFERYFTTGARLKGDEHFKAELFPFPPGVIFLKG